MNRAMRGAALTAATTVAALGLYAMAGAAPADQGAMFRGGPARAGF